MDFLKVESTEGNRRVRGACDHECRSELCEVPCRCGHRCCHHFAQDEGLLGGECSIPECGCLSFRPAGSAPLVIVPCSLRYANAFIARHHRTHAADQGCKAVFGVAVAEVIVGVCVIGRPRSQKIQQSDPLAAEVTRCCTDGTFNAASKLYANAWGAARALGYRRLITYTLPSEGGACLRALRQQGWRRLENEDHQPLLFGGGEWGREDRPRFCSHPPDAKWRWEVCL